LCFSTSNEDTLTNCLHQHVIVWPIFLNMCFSKFLRDWKKIVYFIPHRCDVLYIIIQLTIKS
jgi:hypothetical protein